MSHTATDSGRRDTTSSASEGTWTPGERERGHLEMLLAGAYRPLSGFLGEADVAAVESTGRLADGSPWPAPVTLPVPEELATRDPATVTLTDPEGAPLASLDVRERWRRDGVWHLAGPVHRLGEPQYGAFRRLRRAPGDVAAELADSPALAVVADHPLLRPDVEAIDHTAQRLGARVLLMPVVTGAGADTLVRAVLGVRDELPGAALVVPIPLPPFSEGDPQAAGANARAGIGRDVALCARVAAAYGATHLLSESASEEPGEPDPDRPHIPTGTTGTTGSATRPARPVAPERVQPSPSRTELDAMLDAGEAVPESLASPALAAELRRARPPLSERGLTVFFTGLSGSGKSTIARGLYDALLERGDRTVTLLDGDVVRRVLSAGLTFSKADRDRNIRRIGYVAAEVARHGGLAICAPIAPYAATRAEVRHMVADAGGDFVLVHVATPLEECERRDRKGLYAKARAGEIKEFTGISDPYEEPGDAELVLDTTHMSEGDAVEAVLAMLVDTGWLSR